MFCVCAKKIKMSETLSISNQDGWSKGQTLSLINELKKYPCLYSPLDNNFCNKIKRNEKLNLIVEEIKKIKVNVTVADIKKKFELFKARSLKRDRKLLTHEKVAQVGMPFTSQHCGATRIYIF